MTWLGNLSRLIEHCNGKYNRTTIFPYHKRLVEANKHQIEGIGPAPL